MLAVGATTTVPVPSGEMEHDMEIEEPVGLDTIIDLTIAVVAGGTVNIVEVVAPVETSVYLLYKFAIIS
jgi:hypothetical protein